MCSCQYYTGVIAPIPPPKLAPATYAWYIPASVGLVPVAILPEYTANPAAPPSIAPPIAPHRAPPLIFLRSSSFTVMILISLENVIN